MAVKVINNLRAQVHKLQFAHFADPEKSPSSMIIRMYLTDKPYKQLYMKLIWQFMLFILTINISASIHQAIEINNQSQYAAVNVTELRQDLLKNFSNTHNIQMEDVNRFVDALEKLNDREVVRYGEVMFMEAFIVVVSSYFTIGWGHKTPSTDGGKIFCIINSLLGIPISMLFVLTASKILIRHMKDIIHSTQTSYTGIRNKYGDTKINTRTRSLLFPALFLVLIVYWLLSSAAVMNLKNCSYLDAVYYSFATFTTIGFGKYVVTSEMLHEGGYGRACVLTVFFFVWTLFGVILVAANVLTVCLIKTKTLRLKNRYNKQHLAIQEDDAADDDVTDDDAADASGRN